MCAVKTEEKKEKSKRVASNSGESVRFAEIKQLSHRGMRTSLVSGLWSLILKINTFSNLYRRAVGRNSYTRITYDSFVIYKASWEDHRWPCTTSFLARVCLQKWNKWNFYAAFILTHYSCTSPKHVLNIKCITWIFTDVSLMWNN